MYIFVNCVCVYFPYSNIPEIGPLKKRWLKQQDSYLESFNYESGILSLHPTLSNIQSHIKSKLGFKLNLAPWQPYCKMVDFKVRFNLKLERPHTYSE